MKMKQVLIIALLIASATFLTSCTDDWMAPPQQTINSLSEEMELIKFPEADVVYLQNLFAFIRTNKLSLVHYDLAPEDRKEAYRIAFPSQLYSYRASKRNDSTINFSQFIPGVRLKHAVTLHDQMIVLRSSGDLEVYFGNLLDESPDHNHTRMLHINGATGVMTRYKHGDYGLGQQMWLMDDGPVYDSGFRAFNPKNAFEVILGHCQTLGRAIGYGE